MAKITKKAELLKRAIELYNQDYKLVSISRELNIHQSTLRRWFRDEGVKAKKSPHEPNEPTDIEIRLDKSIAHHDERIKEDKTIAEIADAQASPADQYQNYVASSSIKLLRDSIKNIRGPRTVKELSELDQLIRRNLGLNARNGDGSGSMQIDISILNNTKKAGDKKIKKVIDVESEPVDEN